MFALLRGCCSTARGFVMFPGWLPPSDTCSHLFLPLLLESPAEQPRIKPQARSREELHILRSHNQTQSWDSHPGLWHPDCSLATTLTQLGFPSQGVFVLIWLPAPHSFFQSAQQSLEIPPVSNLPWPQRLAEIPKATCSSKVSRKHLHVAHLISHLSPLGHHPGSSSQRQR